MEIQKPAVAGTLESSDCQVTVEQGENGHDRSQSQRTSEQSPDIRLPLPTRSGHKNHWYLNGQKPACPVQ